MENALNQFEYGNAETGLITRVSDVPDELKSAAQARIDRVSVADSFALVESGDAALFSCDDGEGFVIMMPVDTRLHIELAFSRSPGLLLRQIEYWNAVAYQCGFEGLQCKPGSDAMERYMRMADMAKAESGLYFVN